MDIYQKIGASLYLLSNSEHHRQHSLGLYMTVEIWPPFKLGQYMFYTEGSEVLGLVTWAFISDESMKDILETKRSVLNFEWSNGDNLFINDWIAPFGHSRQIKTILKEKMIEKNYRIANAYRRRSRGGTRSVSVKC